jgi:Immunity protein 53
MQCNGDWEHQYGVCIETLDNPGWIVKVDLEGTGLLERSFTAIDEGTGNDSRPEEPKWLACSVRDQQWQGAADESQLERLLTLFLDWAEVRQPK